MNKELRIIVAAGPRIPIKGWILRAQTQCQHKHVSSDHWRTGSGPAWVCWSEYRGQTKLEKPNPPDQRVACEIYANPR